MKKPFKFTIICNKTKRVIREQNHAPLKSDLETWEPTDDPMIQERKQTRTAYVDTRYEAKLRLFNYLTYTKKGVEIPKYNPFKGTNMGKTEPILNF